MRIVSIADIHLGSSLYGSIDHIVGLHSREIDFLNTLDKCIDFALDPKNKIDLFAILGDLYLDRHPSLTQQRELAKRLARLSQAKKETIIVKGNHDVPEGEGLAHTSSVIQEFKIPHITIVDEPQLIDFEDTAIVAMPYLCRRTLQKKTQEEALEYYIETVEALRSQSGKKNNICLVHQTLEGSVLSAGYRNLSTMDELVIPLSTFKDFDITLAGHIHKHQGLQKTPPILYVGSLDRVDFGEAEDPKGFVLADSVTKKVNFASLPVRDFFEFFIDISGLDDSVNLQKYITDTVSVQDFSTKIFRLSIKLKDVQIAYLNQSELAIFLKKRAWYAAKTSLDIVRTRRSRDADVSEVVGIEDALTKYVGSVSEYKTFADQLIKKGIEIIKEAESA